MTASRNPLAALLAVNFVGALGFSIVLPFLVFLVTRWGGNAFIYGTVGATYSLFQLFGAPLLGRWSDLHGRRRILLLSQIGTLASWLLLYVAFVVPANTLWVSRGGMLGEFTLTIPLLILFCARAFDGLTGGNISVANAYVADITPQAQRTTNFGRMAVAANLGFVGGPALAGLLAGTALGERLPVLAAIVISVAATMIILFALPESRARAVPTSKGATVPKIFGQEQRDCYEDRRGQPPFREIVRLPRVFFLLTLHFLVMLGFNFFYIAFPAHAAGTLEWAVREIGIYFAVLSLLMVIVQGPVLSRASRRWSSRSLVIGGSLILSFSFVFFTSSSGISIYLGASLLALGNGLMWTSLLAILSGVAGDEYQGAVQGIAGASGAVASVLGLLIGGLLYDQVGGIVFLFSAGLVFVVFVLSLRCPKGTAAEPTFAPPE